MAFLAGDDDLERLRDQFDQVLSRREFDYGPSLIDRFMGWLGRTIERILESLHLPGADTGGGGAGVGSQLVALILIIAVVAVVVVLVRRLRRSGAGAKERGGTTGTTIRVRDDRGDRGWMDDYLRSGRVGVERRRLLDAYRRLVGSLESEGMLHPVDGDSPRELSEGLGVSSASSVELMREATEMFERPWYGGDDGGDADPERMDGITETILTEPRPAGRGT